MSLAEKIKNEPVLVTGLTTSVLALLLAFGVPVTQEQAGAILALVGALLAFVARSRVSPINGKHVAE